MLHLVGSSSSTSTGTKSYKRSSALTALGSRSGVCGHLSQHRAFHVSLSCLSSCTSLEIACGRAQSLARKTAGWLKLLKREVPNQIRDALQATQQRPLQAWPRPHCHRALLQLRALCAEGHLSSLSLPHESPMAEPRSQRDFCAQ